MKQFDVVQNPDSRAAAFAPFLVVLSSHLVDLDLIVIAPLLILAPVGQGIVVPVRFNGESYALSVGELAAVAPKTLRRIVGSLNNEEHVIRRAIDRLFTGF